MKSLVSKIFVRCCVFLALLLVLNSIYTHTLLKNDLLKHSPMAYQMIQKKADIFYFGESSNATCAPGDSIKESISELIAKKLPEYTFCTIDTGAVHAGVYKFWLNCISDSEPPKAIIVTMNLRSFGAGWIHSKLETPINKSLVLINKYPYLLNRFMLSLGCFDKKTDQERFEDMVNAWKSVKLVGNSSLKFKTVAEWDEAMRNGGWLKPNGDWDFPKIELSCHYIKAYAFNLNDTNPRVKDFDEIAKWGNRHNVKIIMNLIPENVEYADSLLGNDLTKFMRDNRDYLVNRYSKMGAIVLDNLESVSGRNFIDQNWTSEHYDQYGRLKIAEQVTSLLKKNIN